MRLDRLQRDMFATADLSTTRSHIILREAPNTKDDLWQWVRKNWNVKLPRAKVCPDHIAPFDAFAEAYFAEYPRTVWHASRGFGGKTVLLATLALTEAATLGCGVTLLGGSGEQSQRVHKYMSGEEMFGSFWTASQAPLYLRERTSSKRETNMRHGGYIHALMASQKSVRGPHPVRLRGDEIDEMDKPLWDAAQGQPMSRNGIKAQTVGSSTWQNADGTMSAEMREAAKMGWPIRRWCYRESVAAGWLEELEVIEKKLSIPASMWDAEYENQEPNPQGRAILPEMVDRMFDRRLGEVSGREGEHYEFERPHPQGVYVTGVDWAKERDYTVIDTWRADVSPYQRVAWTRLHRRPWPAMVKVLDDRLNRFGGECRHDATGIGNVVHDLIEHEVWGETMVGRRRHELFSEYVATVESGMLVSPFIEWAHAEHKYCSVDDLYGSSSKGHPPDSVVAASLANSAVKNMAHWADPVSITRESPLAVLR